MLDNYNNYHLYEFECYYKKNNIVIFCIFFLFISSILTIRCRIFQYIEMVL